MKTRMLIFASLTLLIVILTASYGACCENCLTAADKAPVVSPVDYGTIQPLTWGVKTTVYAADAGANVAAKCSKCDGSGKCWVCTGSGKNGNGDSCSTCSGTGKSSQLPHAEC